MLMGALGRPKIRGGDRRMKTNRPRKKCFLFRGLQGNQKGGGLLFKAWDFPLRASALPRRSIELAA